MGRPDGGEIARVVAPAQSADDRPGPAGPPSDPSEVLWSHRRHLAADRPQVAAAALLGGAVLVLAAATLLRVPAFGLLGALIVGGSLADFLLPCSWLVTATGVARRGFLLRRDLAWERVLRAYALPDGVLLSPLPERSWLDAYRGLFVPAGDDREGLLAQVDRLAVARRRPAPEEPRDAD